jgi:hypothetical protein
MKIIRDRSNNIVLYCGEDAELSSQGFKCNSFVATLWKPNKVELIETSVPLPEYYADGKFTYRNHTWVCADIEYLNNEKRKTFAAQRFEMETSGVAYGDHIILTDRESCQILDSTIEKIRRGLIPSVDWKCRTGWITIDSSNMDAVELTVLAHVQTAFAWEKSMSDSLDAQPE